MGGKTDKAITMGHPHVTAVFKNFLLFLISIIVKLLFGFQTLTIFLLYGLEGASPMTGLEGASPMTNTGRVNASNVYHYNVVITI